MKGAIGYRLFGGDMTRDASRLEKIWDEVQRINREAGPWGIFWKKKGD
ncbi:hypothetical protein UA11_04064 [Burkholderia multivorans]|nr:hypothetical protein UA11_04064 [Burkholderia multivorans]